MLQSETLIPVLQGKTMRPREPWISRKVAAALLGVDTATLHRWRVEGQIADVRTWKAGEYVYYHRADVEALKRRLETGPDTDQG